MRKRERWIYRPDPELEDSALWAISMERVGGAAARWSAGVVDVVSVVLWWRCRSAVAAAFPIVQSAP